MLPGVEQFGTVMCRTLNPSRHLGRILDYDKDSCHRILDLDTCLFVGTVFYQMNWLAFESLASDHRCFGATDLCPNSRKLCSSSEVVASYSLWQLSTVA